MFLCLSFQSERYNALSSKSYLDMFSPYFFAFTCDVFVLWVYRFALRAALSFYGDWSIASNTTKIILLLTASTLLGDPIVFSAYLIFFTK